MKNEEAKNEFQENVYTQQIVKILRKWFQDISPHRHFTPVHFTPGRLTPTTFNPEDTSPHCALYFSLNLMN